MKYVLDTSVAIKTVIQEADSAKALRLRDDYNFALLVEQHVDRVRVAEQIVQVAEDLLIRTEQK